MRFLSEARGDRSGTQEQNIRFTQDQSVSFLRARYVVLNP